MESVSLIKKNAFQLETFPGSQKLWEETCDETRCMRHPVASGFHRLTMASIRKIILAPAGAARRKIKMARLCLGLAFTRYSFVDSGIEH